MAQSPLDYASARTPVRYAQQLWAKRPTGLAATLALLLAWMVAAAVLAGGFGGFIAFALLPALGFMGPLLAMLVLAAVALLVGAFRRRRTLAVLTYLEQVVRLNLPLPQMLLAAEQSESRLVARRLRNVRELIEAGAPIGFAIESEVVDLPLRSVRLIQSAERIGQLPSMLSQLLRQARAREAEESTDRLFVVAYPLMLAVVLGLVVSLIMVFVIPKFEKIFMDFRVPLPPLALWTIDTARWLGLPFLIIASTVAWVYLALKLWGVFLPMPRMRVIRPLDALLWYTPLAHGFLRDRGMADICHVVGDALAGGRALDWALAEAGQLRINSILAERVGRWRSGVEAGMAPADAARQAAMPPLLVGMLATGSAGGEAAEAMHFLSRYYGARFSRIAALLRGAIIPGLALLGGLAVCLVVLTVFLPMVRLVFAVLPYPGVL